MNDPIDHEAKEAWAAEAFARHPDQRSPYNRNLSIDQSDAIVSREYSSSPSLPTQATSHSIPNEKDVSDTLPIDHLSSIPAKASPPAVDTLNSLRELDGTTYVPISWLDMRRDQLEETSTIDSRSTRASGDPSDFRRYLHTFLKSSSQVQFRDPVTLLTQESIASIGASYYTAKSSLPLYSTENESSDLYPSIGGRIDGGEDLTYAGFNPPPAEDGAVPKDQISFIPSQSPINTSLDTERQNFNPIQGSTRDNLAPLRPLRPPSLLDTGNPPIRVKVHWQGDLFILVVADITSFATLLERIEKKIILCGGRDLRKRLKLRYEDEDGDLVLLSSDEDLSLALESARMGAGSRKQLRIRAGY